MNKYFNRCLMGILSFLPLVGGLSTVLASDIETRVAQLESQVSKISELETQITNLEKRLDSLKSGAPQEGPWICSVTCVTPSRGLSMTIVSQDVVQAFNQLFEECQHKSVTAFLMSGSGYATIHNSCFKK